MADVQTVAVSGASGLVGAALVKALQADGKSVRTIVRRPANPTAGEIQWDAATGAFDIPALEEVDAIVHLAGESIASGRWTAAKKKRIRDSRVNGTTKLAQAVAGMSQPPRVLVSASAIGWYGSRGADELTEDSGPGTGFLAEVCRDWELAAAAATEKKVRVVHLRIGVVLSARGGALNKMLLPFKLGLGGKIGSGTQYMSCISIDDLVSSIQFSLREASLSGPVNAVGPRPVTNAEFTAALGRALRRPTLFPMPAFAARLAFGEMADELLLSSTRVLPRRLTKAGFEFAHPDIDAALAHVLRPGATA